MMLEVGGTLSACRLSSVRFWEHCLDPSLLKIQVLVVLLFFGDAHFV